MPLLNRISGQAREKGRRHDRPAVSVPAFAIILYLFLHRYDSCNNNNCRARATRTAQITSTGPLLLAVLAGRVTRRPTSDHRSRPCVLSPPQCAGVHARKRFFVLLIATELQCPNSGCARCSLPNTRFLTASDGYTKDLRHALLSSFSPTASLIRRVREIGVGWPPVR